MAKRSLGKWSLIPQEKGFLVGLASVFISPWFFAWYALDELAKCLEDISEDLQALADQELLTKIRGHLGSLKDPRALMVFTLTSPASLISTNVRIEAIAIGMS